MRMSKEGKITGKRKNVDTFTDIFSVLDAQRGHF